MYKGKTFIISGPSGVGKSTVLKELFQDRDDLYFSVSATTRPPRPGEINGVHYHFTDVDEFRKMISEDAFLEYAEYVGNFYGTKYLGAIIVAAYSYMALVPVIQPPIMKALTTKKERTVVMKQLRTVSKTERVIFPIMVTIIVSLIVPDAAVLVGMLMLGNVMKECGVVDRIQKTAGNELMNIITIFLALSVGCTTSANTFLNTRTLFIIVLGLIAFSFGTAAGVLCGKVMYAVTGGQVNPLIGSAGVSAVPMAARVSQKVGQSENPQNFLLMHAMGPNVAGVIGSAVAAGILINIFG